MSGGPQEYIAYELVLAYSYLILIIHKQLWDGFKQLFLSKIILFFIYFRYIVYSFLMGNLHLKNYSENWIPCFVHKMFQWTHSPIIFLCNMHLYKERDLSFWSLSSIVQTKNVIKQLFDKEVFSLCISSFYWVVNAMTSWIPFWSDLYIYLICWCMILPYWRVLSKKKNLCFVLLKKETRTRLSFLIQVHITHIDRQWVKLMFSLRRPFTQSLQVPLFKGLVYCLMSKAPPKRAILIELNRFYYCLLKSTTSRKGSHVKTTLCESLSLYVQG